MVDPLDGGIEWFRPDPRAILPLERFHVPRTLARRVRQGRFELRTDTNFESVMRACAAPRADDDLTWIDDRLIEAYSGLFRDGDAHTVEAWLDDRLVGGLYGVKLGGGFFGESMFSRPDLGGTDASKIALVKLVELMRAAGMTLLDVQFWNPHLEQFGCIEISAAEYTNRLAKAVELSAPWPAPGTLPG